MKSTIALSLLLALLLAGGCRSGGPAAPKGIRGGESDSRARVLLLDRDLRGIIRVENAVADWTGDRRLWARAKIQNRSDAPVHLLVQTLFKDLNGNTVNEEAEWENVLIPQNSTYYYDNKALSTEAYDYLVQIRKGVGH